MDTGGRRPTWADAIDVVGSAALEDDMLVLLAIAALGADPEPLDATALRRAQIDALLLETTLPDPAVATMQSAVVGFGAGHFYARQPDRGFGLAVAQGVGAGLLVGSGVVASTDPEWYADNGGSAVLVTGAVILGVARAVDVIAASHSANKTRKTRLRAARG